MELAISEAAQVISNLAWRQALEQVRNSVLKGVSLSQAFGYHSLFPVYLRQWIGIGERSGKTERVFSQIHHYYQGEVNRSSTQFMGLIEPAMIVLIGALMLTMIIGIVLPLFSMYGSLL